MKWLARVLSLVVCWGVYNCWADEPFFGTPAATAVVDKHPAIMNNPVGGLTIAKDTINYVEPQPEALFNVLDGSWQYGTSFSIYNLKSKGYYLASARAGYATDQTVYLGLKADLEAILQRYASTVPGSGFLGRYGAVGIYGGRNWADNEWGLGITLGGTVRW